MKRNKVLIFAIVVVMMATSLIFSSCTATIEPIKVTLIIQAGEEEVINVTMPIAVKEPTIMALVNEAAMVYELNITYNENGDSVQDIEEYKFRTDADTGISYFWEYLIDGVLPENATGGKANAQEIKDGMVITYRYSTYDPSSSK
jgi:hypothetical protein